MIGPLILVTLATFALPSLRVMGLSVFDIGVLGTLALTGFFAPASLWRAIAASAPVLVFALLMLFGALLATFASLDPDDHLMRSAKLVGTMLALWLFAALAAKRFAGRPQNLRDAMLVSTTLTAVVVIGQGVMGWWLDPSVPEPTRFAGLADHPVEAGYLAAFGIALAIARLARNAGLGGILALALNLAALRYAASMTAVAAVVAVMAWLGMHRQLRWPALTTVFAMAAAAWLSGALESAFIVERLGEVMAAGTDYDTVASRLDQGGQAVGLLTDFSVFGGRGFAVADQVAGRELHNGLLAALFHFGVLGLVGQLALLGLVVSRLWAGRRDARQPLAVALLIVLLAVYFTGPALSRRSLWVPVALTTMMLVAPVRRTVVDTPVVGQLA